MADRQRIRLACWLQQIWQQNRSTEAELDYPWLQFRKGRERVQYASRRYQLAQEHGWLLCLPGLLAELLEALSSLAEALSLLRTAYHSIQVNELALSHWYQEVGQLYDEFVAVTYRMKEGILRVETPSITLAGVDLGPFAIDFKNNKSIPGINDFTIMALNANPASNDSDIHHPHVKDSELCAGEAKAPLKAALAEGRLADAFLLIQSTLQTYNPSSAYVKLEQWNGVPCSDCSRTVNPEENYSCQRCGNTLCDHCFSSCSSCSSFFCPGCIRCCSSCHADSCESCLELSEGNGDPLCQNCRTTCDGCDKVVGTDELDEESQLCQACADQEETELPEEAEATQEVSHT